MQRKDVTAFVDSLFPPVLAEKRDPSGLPVGPLDEECWKTLVALDPELTHPSSPRHSTGWAEGGRVLSVDELGGDMAGTEAAEEGSTVICFGNRELELAFVDHVARCLEKEFSELQVMTG